MATPRSSDPGPLSPALRRRLDAAGLIPAPARWTRLSGGRTNRVYRVETQGGPLVCKLARSHSGSPLFPNAPRLEYLSLQALAPKGLAPTPLGCLTHGPDTCLIYRFLPADPGANADAPALLRRLHQTAPNGLRLPEKPTLEPRLLAGFDGLIARLGLCADARARICQAVALSHQPIVPRLLHGDPVPANIVTTRHGAVLIDWQCPGLGDPCRDLSIALSPAMHHLYGTGLLSPAQTADFLRRYDCARTTARYRALAPALHLQMLAHCAWKVGRGDTDYRAAFDAEAEALRACL